MDKDNKQEKKEKSKFSLQLEKTKKSFSNLTNKMSKSINKTINGIDEKTNPRVGRILNDIFKWTTVSIYILAIPLLVLISQVVNTKDYMEIDIQNYVVQSLDSSNQIVNHPSNDDETYRYVLSYDEFDKSIEEIWNGEVSDENLFRTAEINTINEEGIDSGYSLFYVLYHPYEGSGNEQDLNAYVNEAILYESASAETYKQDTIEYLQVHYYLDNDYQDVNDVKEGFRVIYPPEASTKIGAVGEEPIVSGSEQTEIIVGWTLFSLGIVTGILWFWFSKYSKVSLKKDSENQEDIENQDKKTEGAKS